MSPSPNMSQAKGAIDRNAYTCRPTLCAMSKGGRDKTFRRLISEMSAPGLGFRVTLFGPSNVGCLLRRTSQKYYIKGPRKTTQNYIYILHIDIRIDVNLPLQP